jgi:hypothetical protein
MNSDYKNINVQTMLLLHSIEKLHTLVQVGLMGELDIAQTPIELAPALFDEQHQGCS